MTHASSTNRNHFINNRNIGLQTLFALFLSVALLTTSCGGVEKDTASEETSDYAQDEEGALATDTASDSSDDAAVDDAGDDAEGMFDDASEESDSEGEGMASEDMASEDMASDDMASEDMASDEAAAPRDTTTESAADGGLFDEEESADDEARLEDNRFTDYGYRRFVKTGDDPFSTFALDVDTGSYNVGRRWVEEGQYPPPESVRAEEYINALTYDYDPPRSGLGIEVDGGPSPFDRDNVLVRVGVQAAVVGDDERPDAALTFVIDTSGSMDRDDRLGMVKKSLSLLVDELDDDDTVAIVEYSDNSGVILEPTSIRDRDEILDAIDSVKPGGSTNLESGLREGYALADDAYIRDGVNRVIIASDGVANAGVTDPEELTEFIQDFARNDIQLVTLGFGMGNYNDTMMEQLADDGDGFYAYIDSFDEAERLFTEDLTGTLVTVAIDGKVQVEFDPEYVDEYRLIGYENRGVLDEDFRDDTVDAGELGSGHQATALYELMLVRGVEPGDRGSIGVVNVRWLDPDTNDAVEVDEDIDLGDIEPAFSDTDEDFQTATVVGTLAEVLRDNPYADEVDLSQVEVEADRLADETDDEEVEELADFVTDVRRLDER